MMYLATVHVCRRKRSNGLSHFYYTGSESLVYMHMPSNPHLVKQKNERFRVRATRDLEEHGFGSHIIDTQRRRTVSINCDTRCGI